MNDARAQFLPLLDHLAGDNYQAEQWWGDWHVSRVQGAGNNLLYRVRGALGDFAIKWTLRDERNRAEREYLALHAVHQAGLDLAPMPIVLERDAYAQPVVVQTWLDGLVETEPPTTDSDWQHLLNHYLAIHTLTPNQTTIALPNAVHNARSIAASKAMVHEQLKAIPLHEQPALLPTLMVGMDQWVMPEWSTPALVLCRGDANCGNFIRRAAGWASVDWEYSGWGDPAFEIAELITHPRYMDVPTARWEWVIAAYAAAVADPGVALRIRTYVKLMHVWWVARLARYLYEVPRGLDERLVQRSAGWRDAMLRTYDHYVEWAQGAFNVYPPQFAG